VRVSFPQFIHSFIHSSIHSFIHSCASRNASLLERFVTSLAGPRHRESAHASASWAATTPVRLSTRSPLDRFHRLGSNSGELGYRAGPDRPVILFAKADGQQRPLPNRERMSVPFHSIPFHSRQRPTTTPNHNAQPQRPTTHTTTTTTTTTTTKRRA
jgi:hypothetical protein